MTVDEQVAAVNRYQHAGIGHPLTCGVDSQGHRLLVATATDVGVELVCEDCSYRQLMADGLLTIVVALADVEWPENFWRRPD